MKKLLTYFILPLVIVVLAVLIVRSINEPVKFNHEKDARQEVAIQRLKDLREIQTTFKSAFGYYAPVMDTLIDFYNNGKITIVRQIGSMDDSIAVAKKLVRRENIEIFVRDTLFHSRPDFCIDSLRYIPFSHGDTVIMSAVNKMVSGVNVPLFEAKMPYNSLLKGMDRQLVINLIADREDTERYPGLMVGSIENPNNNAGNWE
ncbi:MAG TPA: hypothetical protein PL115_02175 [Bacteroidales bacterium]|jgi:hypothetical protein|nr:hypothetical protein [Bacteroidales bacterium]HKM12858.1 hypothetical protein [Bacteroidales bacterium]HPB88560.1 hypothetical protein [Bacteroidales bacterium]HPY21457.1 hypothetical protein [Bacteroidales bacterium]HQA92457.1 hypothetical protein [Bacteroidales bacterium]